MALKKFDITQPGIEEYTGCLELAENFLMLSRKIKIIQNLKLSLE